MGSTRAERLALCDEAVKGTIVPAKDLYTWAGTVKERYDKDKLVAQVAVLEKFIARKEELERGRLACEEAVEGTELSAKDLFLWARTGPGRFDKLGARVEKMIDHSTRSTKPKRIATCARALESSSLSITPEQLHKSIWDINGKFDDASVLARLRIMEELAAKKEKKGQLDACARAVKPTPWITKRKLYAWIISDGGDFSDARLEFGMSALLSAGRVGLKSEPDLRELLEPEATEETQPDLGWKRSPNKKRKDEGDSEPKEAAPGVTAARI